VFAAASVSISAATPNGLPGLLEHNPKQLLIQLVGVLATAAWCAIATFVLLRLVGLVFPLRASVEDEVVGLDISLHGEALQ
jgi:Amt family ammonium transporter